jgi:deoxyribose-phosphate aldolase
MSPENPSPAPGTPAYETVARRLDHSLLAPELTTARVVEGLALARRYGVAAAIVRPCDIELAVRALEGSDVRPGSVAGFPHGSQSTAVKLYETRDLVRRGAREIDAVIAVSKLLSREFQYVQTELSQLAEACHKEGAILKVILETAWLTPELKVVACRCAERAEADFIQTSTGFAPAGYTPEDLKLIRESVSERVGVKAYGGADTLDKVLEAFEAGCSRAGTAATAAILDAWNVRLQGEV